RSHLSRVSSAIGGYPPHPHSTNFRTFPDQQKNKQLTICSREDHKERCACNSVNQKRKAFWRGERDIFRTLAYWSEVPWFRIVTNKTLHLQPFPESTRSGARPSPLIM